MGHYQICFMEHNDIQEAANVLSYAMLNNPIHIAVFQGNGETQRLKIERMFLDLFHSRPEFVLVSKEAGQIIGVMRMSSCTGKTTRAEPSEPENLQDIDRRKANWLNHWAQKDPKEQHWHLGPIGVMPTHQGSGVGSLLMKRFCKEVDACHARAFLETDLDINVRFYQKFGFKVVFETEIFGVKSRYMLRDSQT